MEVWKKKVSLCVGLAVFFTPGQSHPPKTSIVSRTEGPQRCQLAEFLAT